MNKTPIMYNDKQFKELENFIEENFVNIQICKKKAGLK